MTVSRDQFKELMAQFATGVCIVTLEHEGQPLGLTVSDFSSVSLEPPYVSINIEQDARSHDALSQGAGFTVNILKEEHRELCMTFAHPGLPMEERFAEATFEPTELGGPCLPDALAWFECKQASTYDGGDHTIFLGEVIDGAVPGEGAPLLYYGGTFGKFTEEE